MRQFKSKEPHINDFLPIRRGLIYGILDYDDIIWNIIKDAPMLANEIKIIGNIIICGNSYIDSGQELGGMISLINCKNPYKHKGPKTKGRCFNCYDFMDMKVLTIHPFIDNEWKGASFYPYKDNLNNQRVTKDLGQTLVRRCLTYHQI